ncbi:FtsX-like permease family protein [Hymenobacter taeanensis]|uniref:FtsX-like permease family protein n=1 Tax=Hymenobacter taeanensis TaxID=2735321 RepID=A0A6M6BIA3_9BACT|nr:MULTISPECIES: ABC transporter permease [Hymenobacter]QJX47033.1 FtsX-like permease family protein [Hymenobacter taeanensis]UOQ80911.1 ABC transporter permease [Hymenobacter sp. 5414T-23]
MLQHSLLLIYRNFKRFKTTFFINLVGLSVGLAGALIIYLWVHDEWSFDRYHATNGRLFRVLENQRTAEGINTYGTAPLLAEALAEEMPEIQYAAAATPPDFFPGLTLVAKGKTVRADAKFAGKDFFRIFSYNLQQGDASQVLANKTAAVLSQEIAAALFGTAANAVGKTVEWQLADLKQTVAVTGVFGPIPANSTDQFDVVLSFDAFKGIMKMGESIKWDQDGPFNTFVVLREGADEAQFQTKIGGLLQRKLATNKDRALLMQPYADLYLHGEYTNGVPLGGRIEYVKLFSAIAVFILVIAGINFMNLATAKASRRLKEIGVKKTLGAGRFSLLAHYLTESVLMSFIALLIALALVELLLPQFNDITGKQLALVFKPHLVFSALGITLITGLLAGSYPAFYLSGLRPVEVLKGQLTGSAADLWTRKGLVVFQFMLSVLFIVCVWVIQRQLAFVESKDLGYNRRGVVSFEAAGKAQQQPKAFLAELKRLPGVVDASSMWGSLVGTYGAGRPVEWEGRKILANNLGVNYDMLETLGITLKEGRSFSPQFRTDSAQIIVNEALVTSLGIQNPVGQLLDKQRIVGVARNFHYESLHEKVKPFIFRLEPLTAGTILVRLAPGREKETIGRVQQFYAAFNPGQTPLTYHFLDEDYQAQYAAERRVGALAQYFAGLAILISCLGLFGLTAFTAEKRRKEIGIRKVLGASELSIVYLLSRDLTKLVGLGILLALPLSYLVVRHWLDSFEYRITLHAWYFLGAGLLAVTVAWLTISTQALQAARLNPTQSLRDE